MIVKLTDLRPDDAEHNTRVIQAALDDAEGLFLIDAPFIVPAGTLIIGKRPAEWTKG